MKKFTTQQVLTCAVTALLAAHVAAQNPFDVENVGGYQPNLQEKRQAAKKQEGAYTGKTLVTLMQPGGEVTDWQAPWLKAPGTEMNTLARTALEVAKNMTLLEAKAQSADMDDGAAKTNLLLKMDVARHELIKHGIAEAIRRANAKLKKDGNQPIRRVAVSNCSTIGDGSRDADLTLHAEDEVREAYLFRELANFFDEQNHKNLGSGLSAADKAAGKAFSVNGMEISFHRGTNDVPPPHEPRELIEFALQYRKNIEKQAANPEAYVGYGAEQEVQGRRGLRLAGKGRPQVLVQTFTAGQSGIGYEANQYTNQKMAMDALRMTLGPDYSEAHDAMHLFCDFVQASHHQHDTDEDVSKGPLKYTKRALNALCRMYGFPEYDKLPKASRLQVIRLGLGPGQPDRLIDGFDTALNAALRNMADGNQQRIADSPESRKAMAFLRRAAARSLQQVARVMMDPPPIRPASIPQEQWCRLNRVEQDALARKDPGYAKRMSVAAMENLVTATRLLAQLDLAEANRGNSAPFGELSLRQVIADSEGNPRLQKVLQLAADHASVDASIERTCPAGTDIEVWKAQRKKLVQQRDKLRYQLSQECAAFRDSDERSRVVKAMGTPALDLLKKCPNTLIPPELGGLQGKRARQAALANGGEDPQPALQRAMDSGKKLGSLAFSHLADPNNIPDLLSLIEMYQNGAPTDDYTRFLIRNLGGRYNPVVGYAVGIAETSRIADAEEQERALTEMGKGLVFDILSRYIPGCAQAKLIFDIEKGIVNVTYGHAIRGLNANLVDAVYLGEAGRKDPAMAGKKGGWVRDAVEPVLPAEYVLVEKDKAGKAQVAVDSIKLYRSLFPEWTGRAHDEIGRITDLKKGAMSLVKAHDKLVQVFDGLAEGNEPSWFEANTIGLYQESDLAAAIRGFTEAADPYARAMVNKALLSVPNLREYKEQRGNKTVDAIEEGLVSRLCIDLIAGMETEWKTLAMKKRQLRKNLDGLMSAAVADGVAQELTKPELHLVKGPLPAFELLVQARTPDRSLRYELNGEAPLPLLLELKPLGPLPDDAPSIEYKVVTGELKPVSSSYRPYKNRAIGEFNYEDAAKDSSLWSNQVFTQPILVQALRTDSGSVIAETKAEVLVRFGASSKLRIEPAVIQGVERKKIRATVKGNTFPQGAIWEWEFEPGRKFSTNKPEAEYEYFKAGTYEVTVRMFTGGLHIVGKRTEKPLAEAKATAQIGDDTELRHEISYWNGDKNRPAEEYWYKEVDENNRLVKKMEGKYTTWHENGKKAKEITYRNGLPHGPLKAWYEDGTLEKTGNAVDGKLNGMATEYHENGKKAGEGMTRDDHPIGKYTTWDRDGKVDAEFNYNDAGRRHGQQKHWSQHSKGGRYLWFVEHYDNGELLKTVWYKEDGSVMREVLK